MQGRWLWQPGNGHEDEREGWSCEKLDGASAGSGDISGPSVTVYLGELTIHDVNLSVRVLKCLPAGVRT